VVHDRSMVPTLLPGDRLLVDPHAYRERLPSVGDLVVLVDPEDPARWLVKRVAGVGLQAFWKTRTGLAPTIPSAAPSIPPPEAVETIVLADQAVYVTGDASGPARDSRQFGPVRLDSLVGRVYRCYAPIERRRNF